ncbi:hypothetical protein ACIRBY_18815 [Streptomyces sp. NPDC096136]|uniref:hypothetical protein n=1 Tax=Streptomyces sp. NPDC096136 TaxID=3366076 RepID=UPI0038006F14
MHGPGIPPQQGPHGHRPLSGPAMTLRVLFTALPLLTCGFFAWGSLLRIALLTRKSRDWVLLVLGGVLSVVWITFIELDPTAETNGWQGNLGAGGSIFTGFAVCVYYIVADIKHHEAKAALPPAAGAAPWYPAHQSPYAQPQQHQPPQQTRPSYGYPPVRPAVPPQQAPAPVQPPRIGQVRAELDELSELLRKQTPQTPQTPPRPPQPGGPYQDPNSTAIQDPQQ